MFVQSRVVYIIKNFAGQPDKIINDLIVNNIFKYFFDDLSITRDRNFLKFVASLPKNTIFCVNVNYNPRSIEIPESSNIAIPFLSSHVNFPIKLGEIVWFYPYELEETKKNTIETYNINGYYLGRVHSLLNTEDTSYCFHDREIMSFSNDKVEATETAGQKGKDILTALEHNEEFIPSTINIIKKPSIDVITNISKNILNSRYYYNELSNYKFNPANTTATMPEDVVLKGSYNTYFELGSSQIAEKGSLLSGGKIQIVAGSNERLRNRSFTSNKSLLVKEIDNSISDDKIKVGLFDNGIEAVVSNSIFYETIKSTNQFDNPSAVSNDIKQGITHSQTNNINNNSSSLLVSQFGIENKEVTSGVNYSIPIALEVFESTNLSGLDNHEILSKKVSSITNDTYPSIVGTSESITFKLHEESDGSIALINPGLDSSYQNYVLLKQDNVHINADKIVIGDANRTGSSLLLGFNDEMQSLVLGEKLNQFLRSIIDIQRISIDTIKNLFKDSKKNDEYTKKTLTNVYEALNAINTQLIAVGSAVGVTPNAKITSELAKAKSNINKIDVKKYEDNIVNFKSNREEELFQILTDVRDNLGLILSNFVKSS